MSVEHYGEPDSKGSDYYIYKYVTNPISKHICFIHPNIITILSLLVYIPVWYNFMRYQPYYMFVLFEMCSGILDFLDGSVARSCNKRSKLGKYLDVIVDFIKILVLVIIVIVRIYNSDFITTNLKNIYILFFVLFICLIVYCVINDLTTTSLMKSNKTFNFYHNNVFIIAFIFHLLLKYFYNSL